MSGESSLGTITKSQSKIQIIQKKQQDNRKQAFNLKRSVEVLLPNSRVCSCCNARVSIDKDVQIKRNHNKDEPRAYYSNLMRCDSVWTCPVCCARILFRRGTEVETAVKKWTQENGGNQSVWMLTLTHRHKKDEKLDEKMAKLSKALSRFFGDRDMKNVFIQAGKVGQIRALEITHSEENGWHPHHHILMFSEFSQQDFQASEVNVTFEKTGIKLLSLKKKRKLIEKGQHKKIKKVSFETFFKLKWEKICKAVGLGIPNRENGLTISNANKVKTYLTKFKTAQELVNATAKKAKNGNRNQWELLADFHNNGDRRAGYLFQVYAEAFKNQRQLFWSRGLKEYFEIEEINDEDIAEIEEEETSTVAEINIEIWKTIRRLNAQSDVLSIAENDLRNDENNLDVLLKSFEYINKKYEQDRQFKEQLNYQNFISTLPPPKTSDDENYILSLQD